MLDSSVNIPETPTTTPSEPTNNPTPTINNPQPQPEAVVPAEEKEVDVEALIPQGPYQADPLFYQLADYFGIKPEEYSGASKKLGAILEHVIRDLKDNDASKILLKLREYEDKLERPDFGERRYEVMYKYVRLASQKSAIERAMGAFERADMRLRGQ